MNSPNTEWGLETLEILNKLWQRCPTIVIDDDLRERLLELDLIQKVHTGHNITLHGRDILFRAANMLADQVGL